MSCDRFIRWDEKKPSQEEVVDALRGFLGEIGTVEVKEVWAYAVFPGKPSQPIASMHKRDDERWFEVFFGEDGIDVITRDQDCLVGELASAFARFCALHWQAKLDMDT